MSVQNFASRTAVRILLLAAAPVLFAACTADQGPSPMPTGYKYLNRQYVVSSNGPVQTKVYPGEYPAPQAAPPMGLQPSPGEMATSMAPQPVAAAPVMEPAPMMASMAPATAVTTTASTSTTTTTTTATATAADAMTVSPQWTSAAADLLTKTEHDFGRLQDPVYVRDAAAGQAGESAFRQALNDVLAERHYKLATDKKMAPFAFDYSVGVPAPTGKTALSLTVLSQAKPIITEKGDYDLNPGAPAMQAPIAGSAVSPVAGMAPAATPPMASTSTSTSTSASAMTVSATPPAPAPVTAPPAASPAPSLAATGAQKPVIVTGPGSAPPPPLPAMAAISTPVPDEAASPTSTPAATPAPTYVYDGRSTNAPGRTAYEQRQGVNHEIDMASPDDGANR
jgi:hypothetical protein